MKLVVLSGVIGTLLSLLGTPMVISFLRKRGYAQAIRESAGGINYPEHAGKRGTPSVCADSGVTAASRSATPPSARRSSSTITVTAAELSVRSPSVTPEVPGLTVNEADGTMTFTVTKTGTTLLASTVDYATAAGTAATDSARSGSFIGSAPVARPTPCTGGRAARARWSGCRCGARCREQGAHAHRRIHAVWSRSHGGADAR